MAASNTFFTNAHDFNIQDAQFITHQTTFVQSPASILEPLEVLHNHRALEASHISKTAASAPKCKPGTRVKAIADLTAWAKELASDPNSSEHSMLWLRGPAGSGKTCIMREVTHNCLKDGLLAGDYFFSTRVPGLDDEAPFVATIVSHLITVMPAFTHTTRETIRNDPTIFEQSLEVQVEKLISRHISSIVSARIIVVDGFDECRDQKQRAHLLRLLYSLVTPPHSFRVIMASRPEYDIRTAFDRPPFKSITKILHLENYETSGEIYQYLSDEFTRICETHPAKQSIPSGWPGQDVLHTLTDKSSGIWVYPSTVIKYVDNPRRHPVQLLEHVLDASSTASSGRPFTELDSLYEIILNPPETDIPLMKRLLHVINQVTHFPLWVRLGQDSALVHQVLLAPNLDDFLFLEKGTTEMTLCDLHSVLSIAEGERPWIYFHHKSLQDYLCSSERAGKLYQRRVETHSDILTMCFRNLELWSHKLTAPNANFQTVDPILYYSCQVWKHLLTVEDCFPPSIRGFDARIAWRCFAFAQAFPPAGDFAEFAAIFHDAVCGEDAECCRCCASFRRMSHYRYSLDDIVRRNLSPMEMLAKFEEECQGLFTPLSMSVNSTTQLDDKGEFSPTTLPNPSSGSRGARNAGGDGPFILESASKTGGTHAPQETGPLPASERPRRWYHALFSCVT
ncbi:hypothetical protein MD484_g413, partial [Candolleomyces efflorescens]